jgi:hypothetical protein
VLEENKMKGIYIPGIAVILVLVLVLSSTTASAAVSLYNFTDSTNNTAYEGGDLWPPTVAFPEINDPYSNLTSNDNMYQTFKTTTSNQYAYTRFEFKINEPISIIEKINMTWMGKGNSPVGPGYKLYVLQNGSWVERASYDAGNTKRTEYIVNTTGFDKIINASGYLIILARSNLAGGGGPTTRGGTIETDFIEVNVAYGPDLNISAPISVKHNYYTGAWATLTNTVKVTVKNNGLDAGSFNVALYADDAEVGTKSVSSLAAGASTIVVFDWIPNEVKTYTLKAAADPENVIDESNEANNNRTKSQAVGHNGYTGDKPLTTYANGIIKGNLFYTSGDSFYSGRVFPGNTYTVNNNVTIPSGATVKFARLYNYWTWSYYALPEYEGKYPLMNLTFDGTEISPEATYDDRKGWGTQYDFPTGTWAYNVTSLVTGSGSHTIVVTNIDPEIIREPTFAMDGLGLLVVYEDASGNEVEYWINEGADMVSTQDTSGGLTPQEATVTSLFPGSINLSRVESARLWTVVQSGGDNGTRLIFNAMNWTHVYDATPYSDLDIDEARDVGDYLVSTDNTAKIEGPVFDPYNSKYGDYLTPSNAFLVINYTSGVPGPNVVVTQNNVSFGGITKGGTREILVSLTLTNTGTAAADIEAKFITHSGAIYGLTNATNVIGGSNFSIGINGSERQLSDLDVQTPISTLDYNATVDYDAILLVPADQVEGDYAGTVQITWS